MSVSGGQGPVVVKLGGDALRSPERIAAQARRLARWAATGPVVAVASARRGVTDHLLDLVAEVEAAAGDPPRGPAAASREEAERAVATGEVVAAALLAHALTRLGTGAVSLDARESGILAWRVRGEGHIQRIRTERLRKVLEEGRIPVVTGFQGWRAGRVVTLGRGGSDTSAVALAVALGASKVVFVKDAAGLRTADPRVVPDTAPIHEAPHRFLTALTRAGSKVVHPGAAELAETTRLPLEFWSLEGEAPETLIHDGPDPVLPIRAATFQPADGGPVRLSVLGVPVGERDDHRRDLARDLLALGVPDLVVEDWSHGLRLTVPALLAPEAVRLVHRRVVAGPGRCTSSARRAG